MCSYDVGGRFHFIINKFDANMLLGRSTKGLARVINRSGEDFVTVESLLVLDIYLMAIRTKPLNDNGSVTRSRLSCLFKMTEACKQYGTSAAASIASTRFVLCPQPTLATSQPRS